MSEQPKDAEAIAALDAFYAGKKAWDNTSRQLYINDMRDAINALDAHRRAHSLGLADDARKVAEALALAECVYRKNCVADGEPSSVLDAMQAALPLAESLPGKIADQLAAVTKERDELKMRYKCRTHERDHAWSELESAESQLAAVTTERDEWRTCAEEKIALLQCEVDAHRKRIEASNTFEGMWRSAEKETIDLESKLAERDAVIAGLREALGVAEKGLEAARKHEVETCEEIGYIESEIPADAFDYIDVPLAAVRAALAPLPEKAPPYEPCDHEAEGAMLYRGRHEARTAKIDHKEPTTEDAREKEEG